MKLNNFLGIVGIVFGSLLFQSCLDDDNYENNSYPNALVTVKQTADKVLFFQLDDSTTLFPTNLKSPLFGDKEVRALVNLREVNESSGAFDKSVYVNWIDSIRTKTMAPNLAAENDSVYGDDPIEIINDWVTVAEDGYLTLRFRTVWGYQGRAHHINLLPTNNPENPYEVELRHNAFGDVNGSVKDGLIAFKLNKLAGTNGTTVKLKLKWKSFSGDKSVEFDYTSRKEIPL